MDLSDPQLYLNRELSWLEFNQRVLEEAAAPAVPLLERLKFLAISASNLDEFFMVRVAGLKQQKASAGEETGPDRLSPAAQLQAIARRTHRMVEEQSRIFRDELLPHLTSAGILVLDRKSLNTEQKRLARKIFEADIFPVLTPLAVDPGHPFPHLRNKALAVAVLLGDKPRQRGQALAVVQVPAVLGRFFRLPSKNGVEAFVLLEELIALHAGDLFPGHVAAEVAPFRITRNWDLALDEDEADDLLVTIQQELRKRDRGAVVRLEQAARQGSPLEDLLLRAVGVGQEDVYRIDGPLQLGDMMQLASLDRPDLKDEPFSPRTPPEVKESSLFDLVSQRDLVLHHPYESFDPVVRFVTDAAEDPAVLAIKQTLYRTSGDSPIVRALARAAENGKQVTALVELKARFDEAANIAWARALEEAGVHVVYGLMGLKTHCKVCLVVRREPSGLVRYVHMGTGNYNPTTARLYTDVSFFTRRLETGEDATALFNLLTGYSRPPEWQRFAAAPVGLRQRVVELIDEQAALGEKGLIRAKMNSLVDQDVIRALYRASQAGATIKLVVRGICCLRPGVPGISETIQVRSIVGRFLEHSRVFAFGEGEDRKVFLASCDWMPRNFIRRVEVMWPVEDRALADRLVAEVLELALADEGSARVLQPDGSYVWVHPDRSGLRYQNALMDLGKAKSERQPVELPTAQRLPPDPAVAHGS